MLEVGRVIGGYRIDAVLGQGSVGTVYEATQIAVGRRVALKVLASAGRDDRFRERFQREMRAARCLDHPNVVPIYDVGEVDHQLFVATRMVRGRTLRELIAAGEVDPARALRLLTPIADAIDAAHAIGLLHRDIKPENIIVAPEDHPFLVDFGLVRPLVDTGLTPTGGSVGAIGYVAPELIQGEPGPSSDIYALGAVLFETLTGVVPFRRDTASEVLFAHVHDRPPRVSDRRPELPAMLDDVIASALAKEPMDRPESAATLMEYAEWALGRTAARPAQRIRSPEQSPRRPARRAASDDDELRSLLEDGARAGVVLEHVDSSSRVVRPQTSASVAATGAPVRRVPVPPPASLPTTERRAGRLVVDLDDDVVSQARAETRYERDYEPARRGRTNMAVLAALAGAAAAVAAVVKWWPFFTVEVTLRPARDTVDCSVFAPPCAVAGERIMIQLFAHVPLEADAARDLASEFDRSAARRAVRGLETSVLRGTSLTFRLTMDGAQVEEPAQSLVWEGRTAAVQFSAVVGDGGERALVGSVAVTQASVPVGHIKFTLEILPPPAAPGAASVPVGDDAIRYRSAFLSYARQDDRHVLRGAQLLRSLDIDCFQDVRDIEPGEDWARRVYAEIERRDLFVLFWSRAARESEWVRLEALHAVECRSSTSPDRPEIKPIILERPPSAPWPELAHLHFDDPLVYFVDVE